MSSHHRREEWSERRSWAIFGAPGSAGKLERSRVERGSGSSAVLGDARGGTRGGGRLRDAAFLHAPEGAFITWWTTRPLRMAVLTGWAAGPSASALSGRSSKALVDEAVRSLGGLFRRRPAAIASELEAWRVHDWLADPWSRGAYSYECIGGERARRRLSEPVEGTLHFAGEATDVTGQASTVAGAIASGERAARQVLESL